MNEYVTDTHALLWYLFGNDKLSPSAASLFAKTDAGEARIYIPSIVLVEIVYLIEKARIPLAAVEQVIWLLEEPTTNYRLSQIRIATIRALTSLPRQAIPDMPDRIIAATAVELQLPLITKDTKITTAGKSCENS